jgi:hypothetical protein
MDEREIAEEFREDDSREHQGISGQVKDLKAKQIKRADERTDADGHGRKAHTSD